MIFITHPQYKRREYKNPWGDHGYALGKYNCKELEFEPYEGLLTLKKEFSIADLQDIESLRVTATALGMFDIFLNGSRIGDNGIYDEYKPGWTDYRSRVFTYEYDITSLAGQKNIFVAEVSAGWWSGRISYGFYGFPACAFAAQITVTYKSGQKQVLTTGEDWQASICGPVLRADIWDGEYFDARIPHASRSPYAHKWENACIYNGFSGNAVPKTGPSVRVKKWLERTPESATVICGVKDNGTTFGEVNETAHFCGEGCDSIRLSRGSSVIFDIGQNMVGRPVLKLCAERGTKICVYFAEMLNDSGDEMKGNDGAKGSLYMSNYRSALSRITYIASGEQEEAYFPTHSFFGFRYIEIEADGDIALHSLKCEVIGSCIEETGTFECDNEEINRLYSNILWGMRGNYFHIPTDCPQRDERFGWTGDTQVFCGAAAYMADVREFMRKWLGDLRDSQAGFDGAYCDVAPRMFSGEVNSGNAAWADAGIIVPYRMYLMYGDTQIIAEHYASMEAYMKYLSRYGNDGAKDFYGDWLCYDKTDNRYIAMSYYVHDAELMYKMSKLLGKHERAEYYKELYNDLLLAWREKYICNAELIFDTQTAYALAIEFELLPDGMRSRVAEKFKNAIEKNENKLSTGFVGTGILCNALSSVGLDNLCYNLLLQPEYPGWLYSVRQGATTVWERWNSYTKADGFGKVTMNSFNHYAYGAVAEWLYSCMCGIKPDKNAAGFEHFCIYPSPDLRKEEDIPDGQRRICHAFATYKTDRGIIESSWEYDDGTVTYELNIPNGTKAEIGLMSPSETLIINGQTIKSDSVGAYRRDTRLCFELSSGKYIIKTNIKEKKQ